MPGIFHCLAIIDVVKTMFMDTKAQIEHDFQLLLAVVSNDVILISLAICGMILQTVVLIIGTDMFWLIAMIIALIPHIVVSYITLKAVQRSRMLEVQERPTWTTLDIINAMSDIPQEDFILEEDLKAEKCSTEKLRSMLEIRQNEKKNSSSVKLLGNGCNIGRNDNEKSALVDSVLRCRKYNGICCVCFEDFKTGDKIRVLPGCHHEYHTECIDKWAITFATSRAKQAVRATPSCPVCNTSMVGDS